MLKLWMLAAVLTCSQVFAHGKDNDHHKDGYASATINDPALQIFVAGLSLPIYFDLDLVEPFNIKHPYQSDNSQFCVQREGSYLIGWKMNLTHPGQDVITFNILDMKTETPILATTLVVPVSGTIAASTQFVIYLEKGGVIKLTGLSQNGNTALSNPTFFITRIGH